MKITDISVEHGKISYDDGTTIEYFHNQGCCEQVYADFEQLLDTDILQQEFRYVFVELVPKSGFRLNGYFVPCYNEQNGYYSSDLALIVSSPSGETWIDLDECVEDRID